MYMHIYVVAVTEIQIRGGIEDNFKIVFLFLNENNVLTPH